jgi:uncharacterized protein YbjQ (UPF0145 family)
MILTTTPSIEGFKIRDYRGIVTGETILGANIFRDFMASITDVVGGHSRAYEHALKAARQAAFRQMEDAAKDAGGNAIIGIDIDYEVVGKDGTMLMVTVSGTAVVIE